MSRSIRDAGLEKAAARARLAPGLKHWRLLEVGLHLGYRRGRDGGGSWIARRIASGKYVEHRLGRGDDLVVRRCAEQSPRLVAGSRAGSNWPTACRKRPLYRRARLARLLR